MHDYIIDINELSDSRELLEAKPPKVIKIFIYVLLAMLVAGFIWISIFSIEITIKSPGIIRPIQNISGVKNVVSGTISSILFKDGEYVDKGELLYKIDTKSLDIDYKEIKSKILRLEDDETNTTLYKESIAKGLNLFSQDNIRYYNRYLNYELEKEKLNLTYLKAKRELEDEESLLEGMQTKRKLDELKSTVRFNQLNIDSYISRELITIEDELRAIKDQLITLRKSRVSIEESLRLSRVKAAIAGRVQQIQELNPGDFLQQGVEVLRIIPSDDSLIKVDIMVSNSDIAGITIGDRVTYRFQALPQGEYGVLTGTITKIPGDITSTGTGNSVYVLEGSVKSNKLSNNKGVSVYLKSGMLCDARIITREQKILDYLLEKLDFKS